MLTAIFVMVGVLSFSRAMMAAEGEGGEGEGEGETQDVGGIHQGFWSPRYLWADAGTVLPTGWVLDDSGWIKLTPSGALPRGGAYSVDENGYLVLNQGYELDESGNPVAAQGYYIDDKTGHMMQYAGTGLSGAPIEKDVTTGEILTSPGTDESGQWKEPEKTPTQPNIFEILGNIIGWILYWIVYGLSIIVAKEVDVLLTVMSYPINLSLDVVSKGWAIVRDVCNNFFIVIMLAIAVGTIFRIPSYRYRDVLPKLLIAAILVNFSKLIAGVFIDVSQILMLSFAAPLVTIKGNNIILAALGLPDLYSFMGNVLNRNEFGIGNVIVVLLWGVIVSFVAFIVIACIIAILIVRIIYLLFLAILSPVPFFFGSLDRLKGYGKEWWDLFTKYLIVGPAMLFFLWISFTIMGFNSQTADRQMDTNGAGVGTTVSGGGATRSGISESTTASQEEILSRAMTTEGMINFGFVIALLVLSLVMGQRFGGAGGKFAGMGMSFLDKQRKKVTSLPGAAGKWGAGRVVGSKPVGAVAGAFARGPLRFLGAGRLANVVGKQRVAVTGTKAKYEQDRISTIAKSGGYSEKSEAQLQRLANSKDRYTRLAAIQTLSQKGLLRDDASLTAPQRQQRIGLINRFRGDLSENPEFQQKFDDDTRKYSPNLALQSYIYDKAGNIDMTKLTSDMTTGKMDLTKLMGSLDSDGLALLTKSLVAADPSKYSANDGVAKFIMEQTRGDQKDMEKVYGAMSDDTKKKVTEKVDHTTFKDDDARDAFIKSSKTFDFAKLFKASEAEKRDNYVSENGAFIASNINAKTTAKEMEGIIKEIGHALDPKHIETLTGRSKDMKTKVQDAFKGLAGGISGANIAAAKTDLAAKQADTKAKKAVGSGASAADIELAEKAEAAAKAKVDGHKNTFQNTLLSGAELDVGTDADRQEVLREVMKGKKKKDILEKMNSKNINQNFVDATYNELSGKDYETVADRSKEDKAALKEAFTKSIASAPVDEAAKMINKSLSAKVFDESTLSSTGANPKFQAALKTSSSDQLANLDSSMATNNAAVTQITFETSPNVLFEWLSSRSATNTALRNAVLNKIQGMGAGTLHDLAKKKNLI